MRRYLLGLGNYAMGDDGIGLRVVEYIAEHGLEQGFEAVEVGNDGMQVLTYFRDDVEKLVIVDCAKMGREPGDCLVFGPEDVDSRKLVGAVSTHEGDALKLIALGRQLDCPIPEIRIVAIEPKSLDMEMGLSDILSERMPVYVETAVAEIAG